MPAGRAGKTLGPPIFGFSRPGHQQAGIANHFAFQAVPRERPEQAVVGIDLGRILAELATTAGRPPKS